MEDRLEKLRLMVEDMSEVSKCKDMKEDTKKRVLAELKMAYMNYARETDTIQRNLEFVTEDRKKTN